MDITTAGNLLLIALGIGYSLLRIVLLLMDRDRFKKR